MRTYPPKQLNELSWNLVGIEASAAELAEKLALSWKVISILLWLYTGRFFAILVFEIFEKKMPNKYLQLKPSLNFFCRNKKNYLIYNLFCNQKTKLFFVLNKLKGHVINLVFAHFWPIFFIYVPIAMIFGMYILCIK